MTPYWIGLTVAAIIAILAPLTQAGINPARDFGPRLVALIFGWGSIAIPGPRSGFWIYIVGPPIGTCTAGLLYSFALGRHYKEQCLRGKCHCE